MRKRLLEPVILIGTALLSSGVTSCTRSTDRRDDEAAHKAGQDAYRATQDIKRDAKEAAKQLHDAGSQFREGWNQAKHENHDKDNKPNPPDR